MILYLFLDDLWINESWILNLDTGAACLWIMSVSSMILHTGTSTWYRGGLFVDHVCQFNDTPLRNIHLVQGRLVCGSCLSVQWYSTPEHPLGTGAACLWIMSVSSMILHSGTSTWYRGGLFVDHVCQFNDTPLRNIHLVQGRLVCGSCLSVQWYSTPEHPLGTGAACLWIMSVSSMILHSGTSTWYRGGLFVDHVCQFNDTPKFPSFQNS